MKAHLKFIVLILSLFCAENLFCQIHFENGYFISNDGKRVDCLIKNEDWNNNPVEFKYKLPVDDNIRTTTISDVKEFEIENYAKYVRADVNIDMSLANANQLTYFKKPIWEKQTVFLKVLVAGKASLYLYKSKKTEDRFFYKPDNSGIEQLVYKEYRLPDSQTIMENDSFKIQLQTRVICASSAEDADNEVEYEQRSLVRYFNRYNQCVDPSFKIAKTSDKRNVLDIGLYGGLNISSASFTNSATSYYDGKFNALLGFHIGMDFEFILPFNKNQWSLLLESEYARLNYNTQSSGIGGTLDYNSWGFSAGAKRYFFINDKLKWFIGMQVHSVFSTNFNSYYTKGNTSEIFDIRERMNFGLGVGVEWNRWFAEVRGYTNQDLMTDNVYWNTNLKRWSLNVGYKLFKLSSKGAK